jgi:hypothetical protein
VVSAIRNSTLKRQDIKPLEHTPQPQQQEVRP